MQVYAIIPAAGSGKRFDVKNNSLLPKQFSKINNIPVLIFSLIALSKSKKINRIIISADSIYFDYIHSLIHKYKFKIPIELVQGGISRYNSVKNAFTSIDGKDNDIVLVHDAARPNINRKMIDEIINKCKTSEGVVFGIKAKETVKIAENGFIQETIDRSKLWLIQTPQAFKFKVLKKSYTKVKASNHLTDESILAERGGFKIKLIEGSITNIKITTRDDMELLKKVMRK